MKIKAAMLALAFVSAGCGNSAPKKKYSFIHGIVDFLPIDKSANILIYTINPNDCISCLNGFKDYNGQLYHSANLCLYVISVEREVERKALEKKITYLDLRPQKNKSVIWNKNVFDSINYCTKTNLPLTTAAVYNFQHDSVLFAKPVREITDVREISEALSKKP